MKTKIYEVEGPDGKIYELEGPENATEAQVTAAAYLMYRQQTVATSQDPQKSGFIPSLKEGAIGALEATKRGISAPFMDEAAIRQDIAGEQAAAKERNVGYTPFSAVPEALKNEGLGAAIGTTYDAARDALGRSLPYMGPTVAGAATGARLGALTSPVTGFVGPAVGGLIGGVLGGGAQFAGTNIERRVQEGTPGPLVTPEVYATAAGQAALDTAATAFTLGGRLVSGILGKPLSKVAEPELLSLAQRSLRGAARGAAAEMPTEVAQQILERKQAGLSLTSDDAYAEYGEAAAAASVLGGVVGGVGGAAGRAKLPPSDEDKLIKDEQARIKATQAEARTAGRYTEQAQMVEAERQADIAGKAGVDEEIARFRDLQVQAEAKKQDVIARTQAMLPEISARLNADLTEVTRKLDTIEGTKELLNAPEIKKDKAAQQELQQYLTRIKQAEAAEKKMTPTKMKYMLLMDTQDVMQKRFGVSSEEALRQLPASELQAALNELKTEQPSVANRYTQAKFNTMERKIKAALETHPEIMAQRQQEELSLEQERAKIAEDRRMKAAIKAREKELALFDNDPMKKAAFEQGPEAWDAYVAQEQTRPQIPDEAFPQAPEELSYEEKMAQLERARNEYEAEMFQLDEQYPSPSPTTTLTEEETVNEQIPAGQQSLFTRAGKPSAAAMRGAGDTARVSEVKQPRAGKRDGVPSIPGTPDITQTEDAEQGPLGDAGGVAGRPAVRAEASQETRPSALSPEERDIQQQLNQLFEAKKIKGQTYRGYMDMLVAQGPEPTNAIAEVALADLGYKSPYKKAKGSPKVAKDLEADYDEAKANEDIVDDEVVTYDDLPFEPYDPNHQYFGSRKGKRRSAPKNVDEPQKVSDNLREPSTEPTTPELFKQKIEQWFNPVWYKRAVQNGMVNVIDGDINDSNLSDDVKEKYKDAKALFTPEGKAYFFLKNITKGNELGVFLHEIGEHRGLDNLIGKDRVKQLANRVRQMAEGKGSAKEVAMAKEALMMAEGQNQNDKEVIAYFGEIAVFNGVRPGAKNKPEFGKAVGWITELWGAIKNAISKLNLNPEKVTDKDIVDMLYGAARLEMGAAQTFNEQVGEQVEDAPEILTSTARNPTWQMTPEEREARAAQGLPETGVPQRQNMKEKMLDTLGVDSGARAFFDKMGNNIVGPMYAIHRKAVNYYGSESFYNKTTGKLLGSLFLQHAINGNNLAFRALGKGTLNIDEQGYVSAAESQDNLQTLNEDYQNIIDALVADGASPAVAVQQAANMIFADRYRTLKAMGVKSKEEFTSEQIAEGKALQERHAALYQQWRDRYNRIRDNKINFMVDAGIATRKEAEKFFQRNEYVPLYRVTGSEAADGVYMQGLLSAKRKQTLDYDTKDYQVADVMTNIAKNEMWLYKQAIFNHATNLMVDQVEDMGAGRHVKVKNPNDKQTISYLRDGELKYFRFDDPNDMAALYAVPVIDNAVVRLLRAMGGILRKGITLTPSFVYRQVWQDAERTWMQSGTDRPFVKMLGESIRQQAKNLRTNETAEATALRDRGVVGAVEFQDSFDNAIDELFGRDKTDPTIWSKAYKGIEYMERLAQNSDLAARAIVYKAAIDDGYTPGEAALRAQMMLNYQHRGTSPLLRTLLSTIPFINTQIQSDWRLVEALQGKVPGLTKEQAKKMLFAKMAKMALFTAAYAMTRTGDDDYERASDENRNRNFLFNIGGAPMRIPVAPEYMLLKSGVEQVTRKAIDAEFYEDRKLGHAVATSLANLLLGPSELTPAVFIPLIENATNYSFFQDRQLVGTSLQGRATNLQFNDQTSELAKFISDGLQATSEATGLKFTEVAPIKIDNLINGIFGTIGRDIIFATNQLADAISDTERPDLKPNQYFEVGTAFYDPKGNQRVSDFYREYDKVMTAYNSYNSLKKTDPERARKFIEDNRKLISLRAPAEATKRQLDRIRDMRNRISANKEMSGEEKRRRIDELTDRANKLVTEPTKRLRERME